MARSGQDCPARERLSLDRGWSFAFGHPSDPDRDHGYLTREFTHLSKAGYGDGPADPRFDDRGWRRLDLPHDWAAELPFSPEAGASHGFKALGARFPDSSVAWYRRRFKIGEEAPGRRTWVEFDGVYRDAQFWLNGFHLGGEPSGYLGFRADLTDYLSYGGDNVLAVRVDARAEEGWYYEGAGIYRHVWLDSFPSLRVAHDGVFASSAIEAPGADGRSAESAKLRVETTVANDGEAGTLLRVSQRLIGPGGAAVAAGDSRALRLEAGARDSLAVELAVASPLLWSPDAPALYRLETRVHAILPDGDCEVDSLSGEFGFRSIRFDPDSGFHLNGRRLELKGTNNHQDHAGVGTALPDALHYHRVARLKELGCNAYRASHHPPARELLEACDRLGMLVIDENRLMGSSAKDFRSLERMALRDRNHPSVILWSVGNEEWAIEGDGRGARIAARMQAFMRRLDPTRPVTAAVSGGWGGGISSVIEIMGFNYVSHGSTDLQHRLFPRQCGLGTEETTTQGSRGVYRDDPSRGLLAPREDGTTGGNCETGWKHYASRPYLAGIFFWTGFDYRGEPAPLGWPAVLSQFGILDSCGFEKDSAWYLRSWWRDESMVRIAPHWNWPGREGKDVRVWVYSNAEEVELFLNGATLGRKAMERDGHLEWTVPYQPGSLLAVGYSGGGEAARHETRSSGKAARIALSADRTGLAGGGRDAAVVKVWALDADGLPVPDADNEIEFAIEGPGLILGVGNGDPGSHEADRSIARVIDAPARDWREKPAPETAANAAPGSAPPEAAKDADLSAWEPGFVSPPWNIPLESLPPPPPAVFYRARFALEEPLGEDAVATLCLSSWSEGLTAWVNGHPVARDLPRREEGHLLPLPIAILEKGENSIVLLATGLGATQARYPDTFNAARVRIDLPGPAWRRRLFNGLAQVIAQAGEGQGSFALRASAPGLEPARLVFTLAPPSGPGSDRA